MPGYGAYSGARRRNEVICERCNKGRRERRKGERECGIICGCKKRLIAMVGCKGGQCNAVNAHRGYEGT